MQYPSIVLAIRDKNGRGTGVGVCVASGIVHVAFAPLRRAAAVARLSRRGRNCTLPFFTRKSMTWISEQSQHRIL